MKIFINILWVKYFINMQCEQNSVYPYKKIILIVNFLQSIN